MKKTLKLIPALVMLLVSAILVSTTTYAWFSMNNRVTVTGMTVRTKVSSNLLISEDTAEANFTTGIAQTRAALLEPASTVDGETFYYTINAKADGSINSGATYTAYDEVTSLAVADTAANKVRYDKEFNSKYAVTTANSSAVATGTAYAYVDYNFYLKATSTEDTQKVALTFCNLKYNGGLITDKAFRVAVFATDPQTTAAATDGDALNLKSIITPSGARYQTTSSAVNSTTTVNSVSDLGTAVVIGTLNTGDVKYFKVTVRLWLEGEDTTCTNATFVELTQNYTLDLSFVLSGVDGVTNIVSAGGEATAAQTAVGTASALINTSESATTYQWYVDGGVAGTSATQAATTGQSVYCVVTTDSGVTYTTNTVVMSSGVPTP
ncbi:MAG: hypothetical protein J5940_07005 [Clostridia bacterium]|nr:hypothetical protein [Clostridia bacterium]